MNRRAPFWLAVVAASLGFAAGAPAADSEDQPSIEVTPEVARPGEEVTVAGECWGDCDGSPVPGKVTLLLKGTDLADDPTESIEPDDRGSFELEVELPEELKEGEYTLVAESPDGQLRARDEVRVARRDPDGGENGGGGERNGNGDDGDDNPDRTRARDEDDCEAPPATTDSAADEPAAEGQGQSETCPAPPPTAPAGSSVLGESEDSDGDLDEDSGNRNPDGDDGEDDRDGGDGRDGDERDLQDDNHNGKNSDSDDGDDDEDGDSGGGGGGGNDRGKDSAPAAAPASDTTRSAAGPAPDDLRQPVPWALIGVLGALFAVGLGATYHVVGRWAPDPADMG